MTEPTKPKPRSGPPADLPDPPAIPPSETFLALCERHEIAFDPGDLDRLGRFLALLLAANERINLTAIRDPQEAWTRHIFDALTLLPHLAEFEPGSRVIDVGTGGGVPGVPLAIAMPRLGFTLLEATGKKAEFLRLAIERLGLGNARVMQDRAERAAVPGRAATTPRSTGVPSGPGVSSGRKEPDIDQAHRESYDAALARALGPIRVASELTVPFIRPGGMVLLIKGQKADEELADATNALRALHAVHAGTLDTPTGKIVRLGKASATPRRYPRRDGEPKRDPL